MRSVAIEPSPYGLTSMFLPLAGTSMPVTVAATDIFDIAGLPQAACTGARYDTSFLSMTRRRKFIPQTWPFSLNRNERNGNLISTVHPFANVPVFTSHRPFQSLFGRSFVIDQSSIPPSGLTANP